MFEIHEDYQTGKITEVEVPEIPEAEQEQPIIVDRAEYADDWVKGYLNGELVIQMSGVSDISAVELFDAAGNRVTPVPAPPCGITRLQLAMAEMIEMSVQPAISSGRELHVGVTPAWEITPTYAIVDLYATLINKGLRTLESVPEKFKTDAKKLIAE